MKYCPQCANLLVYDSKIARNSCPCGYVHWNSPTPVVATLVLYTKDNLLPYNLPDQPDYGLLLVQRGIEPQKSGWCFPAGYINQYEEPTDAAKREVREETGIEIEIQQILSSRRVPNPHVNQTVTFYLANPIGGLLQHGDDAQNAKIFSLHNHPSLCFSTHQETLDAWKRSYFASR